MSQHHWHLEVGMYISDPLNYMVLQNISTEAFQALWNEIILDRKKNIVCGIFFIGNTIFRNLFKYTLMKLSKNIFPLTGPST